MKKVGILARVSTETQAERHTIDSQIAALESFCKKEGYLIVRRYIDEGYSGEMLARPALDKMRDDARNHVFEALVMLDPDRLSRKHVNAIIIMEELRKDGVEVFFLNAPNTGTPEGKLLFDIQSVVAEYEKEKIKERTRRGRIHKAKQGLIIGGIPSFGYRYVKKEKGSFYEILEEEAQIIRFIFKLYTQKRFSMRGICRELYVKGIETRKGLHKTNWSLATIQRILTNTAYIGFTYYNKHQGCEPLKPRVSGYRRITHSSRRLRPREDWILIKGMPPIIDQKIFEMAQEMRKKNSDFSPRNAKRVYLVKGLVYHLPCGSRMHGYGRIRQNKQEEVSYRCGNKDLMFPRKKICSGQIAASKLDEAVWHMLEGVIFNPKAVWAFIKHKEKNKQKAIGALQKEISLVEQRLADIDSRDEKLVHAYAEGLFTAEQIEKASIDLKAKKSELQGEKEVKLKELNELGFLPRRMFVYRALRKLARGFKKLTLEKKLVLVKELLARVDVGWQKAVATINISTDEKLPKVDSQDFAFITSF